MGRKYRVIEERLRLYNEVIRLGNLGLSDRQIARIIKERYGISLDRGSIFRWIKGKCHPLGNCNRLVVGPGLAYVIGAWLGDGSLGKHNKYKRYVFLRVKDYEFAEEWGRRLAEAFGRSEQYVPKWQKSYQRWVVRASSKLHYNLLKRAREDPWTVWPYLEKYPAEACRGFFDAEGWVNIHDYTIAAGNTDPDIIGLLEKLLEKLDIDSRIYRRRQKEVFISPGNGKPYRHKDEYIMFLYVKGKENILRFADKVGFTIARKRAGLALILQQYNNNTLKNLRLSSRRGNLEKVAKILIATNLRRLGLMTRLEAARSLSIDPNTVSRNLHGKTKWSKFSKLSEIEELSKEYFYTRSEEVIKKVQKILEAIIEIYNGQ